VNAQSPKPPAGAGKAGAALWRSVLAGYDLEQHELLLLREAVRTVDVLDELTSRVAAEGSVVDSPQGLKAHPGLVEARQQRITYARLLAALRLPAGEEAEGGADRRPQRRGAPRGPYSLSALPGGAA